MGRAPPNDEHAEHQHLHAPAPRPARGQPTARCWRRPRTSPLSSPIQSCRHHQRRHDRRHLPGGEPEPARAPAPSDGPECSRRRCRRASATTLRSSRDTAARIVALRSRAGARPTANPLCPSVRRDPRAAQQQEQRRRGRARIQQADEQHAAGGTRQTPAWLDPSPTTLRRASAKGWRGHASTTAGRPRLLRTRLSSAS